MNRRSSLFVFLLLGAVALICSCTRPPAPQPSPPTIVFMTDFGTANDSVAICKAVILQIAPTARILDITHQVTPFSIEEGARFLAAVSPYYPPGTIFLTVVDPGVGTSRRAIIVKTKKGQLFVLPDNGLITPVLDRDGLDIAREITNQNWLLQTPLSSTFHGRDVFSPVAAHLAAGWEFNLVGPVVPQLVQLAPKSSTTTEKGIDGSVIGLDDPLHSKRRNLISRRFTPRLRLPCRFMRGDGAAKAILGRHLVEDRGCRRGSDGRHRQERKGGQPPRRSISHRGDLDTEQRHKKCLSLLERRTIGNREAELHRSRPILVPRLPVGPLRRSLCLVVRQDHLPESRMALQAAHQCCQVPQSEG